MRPMPFVDDSLDIPRGTPTLQEEIDEALDSEPRTGDETPPDPRIDEPDSPDGAHTDNTDTGESQGDSAGDTTMISRISSQGNNETRDQVAETPSELHAATEENPNNIGSLGESERAPENRQEDHSIHPEELMNVSEEVERTRPRWDMLSRDWSNPEIKALKAKHKAFIGRLMRGEMTDLEDQLHLSPQSVLIETLNMLPEQWQSYRQDVINLFIRNNASNKVIRQVQEDFSIQPEGLIFGETRQILEAAIGHRQIEIQDLETTQRSLESRQAANYPP